MAWSQRAVHLDPNFAMTYSLLGVGYHNFAELNLAAENVRKGQDCIPYVRGKAYLAAREGSKAAGEFQKIIDHHSMGLNPVGALAHLGLARAFALQADAVKAKTAYQDFLNLWKDADPDIPILKEAKVEYAKLRSRNTI